MTDRARPQFEHVRESSASNRFAVLTLLTIGVGGAFGAITRYGIEHLNPEGTAGFPTGTFVANVTGAFALGLLLAALERVRSRWFVKPLIATGFLGAYTTFSTFAVELVVRIKDEEWAIAVVYAVLTLTVGFALAWVGYSIGHRLPETKGEST